MLFWRTKAETLTHHRNPLLNDDIGVSNDSFAIDTLHTLYLGVCQRWTIRALWMLLLANVFRCRGTTEDEIVQIGVMLLRAELWEWYGQRQRETKGMKMSKLNNLTLQMLGGKSKPTLKTKADETKWLTFFAIDMLSKFPVASNKQYKPMLEAGLELANYIRILDCNPMKLSEAEITNLLECGKRHLLLLEEAGVPYTPKHHLFLHMTVRTARKGNPRFYATFLDESLNGKIAKICRSCHRSKIQGRVFVKYGHAHKGVDA